MAQQIAAPRWFFGALVPHSLSEKIDIPLKAQFGERFAGASHWAPGNRHQSFSDVCRDPEQVERLKRAGLMVAAESFSMALDYLECVSGKSMHWSIRPSRQPAGFTSLKAAIRRALRSEGIVNPCSNTPHITLSYRASLKFESRAIEPIDWTIDTLMLLQGGGDPYHYQVVEQWPLMSAAPSASPQQALF